MELRNPARTPSALRASTWSCISAMSGEMTTPTPGRTSAGNLVAQRLAAAGRHEHQRVAAADDVIDDLLLLAAERVVAEDPAQRLQSPATCGLVPGDATGRFYVRSGRRGLYAIRTPRSFSAG